MSEGQVNARDFSWRIGDFPVSKNLTLRVLTAALGIPFTLFAVSRGGWLLFALALVVGSVALLELYRLAQGRLTTGVVPLGLAFFWVGLWLAWINAPGQWPALVPIMVIGASWISIRRSNAKNEESLLWQAVIFVAGALYVLLPLAAMLRLRALEGGAFWLSWLLILTWVTDTTSYFAGRAFGRRALAPRISPKKTWEGALAGWLSGALISYLLLLANSSYREHMLPLILLAPVVAILGDLGESRLKRYFASKDSGLSGLNLFPGHGGVLDRLDSLLVVAPFVVVYLTIFTDALR